MGYLLAFILQFLQFTMVAIGVNMVFSVGGIYFHAAPAVYIVAAYSLAISQKAGWPLGASLIVSLALVLVLAGLFAFLQKRFNSETFEVITISSALGFYSIANSWLSLTNGPLGISGIPRPEHFSSLEMFVLVHVILCGGLLLVSYLLLNSKFGRALRAAKEHPDALESLGLSKQKVRTGAIFFACLILMVSAWSTAWEFRFLTPGTFGIETLVSAASVAILAAKPKIRYILFAGAVVGLVPELLRFVDLPAEGFGYLRSMSYSVIVISAIWILRKQLSTLKRSV